MPRQVDGQPADGGRFPQVEPLREHLTDDLLLAAGRGDLVAYADFYDGTSSAVFGLLRSVLGERVAAELATARVYTRLWRTAPYFDPTRGSAYSLLMLTARRELVKLLRDIVGQPS